MVEESLEVVKPKEGVVLQINDRCDVQWRKNNDGCPYLPAKIVERRSLDHRNKRRKRNMPEDNNHSATLDLDSLPPDQIEYYVHYIDHDRRLDEWVTLDRFKLDTLQRSEDEIAAIYDDTVRPPATTLSLDETPNFRQERRRSRLVQQSPNNHNDEMIMPSGGNWHTGGNTSNDPELARLEREHEEETKVKNIEKIILGNWEVETWYYSPFPAMYSDLEVLYVCEYCLSYMKKRRTYAQHRAECKCRHPPGKEIYHESDLSVYEIDGKDSRAYCQKLCLLAKLFLDHKTLYYDVVPFYFYIITKVDEKGAHIVGYFSKEKASSEGYNLACILTFPQYQKLGYGKFIISLSYELTKRQGGTGSPEKPLSDLGKVSYRSYWTHILMNLLDEHDTRKDISIQDMCTMTGIKAEDIISTLQHLDMIEAWKGQHVVHVKQSTLRTYLKQDKKFRLCKPEFLNWEPPSLMGEDNKEV